MNILPNKEELNQTRKYFQKSIDFYNICKLYEKNILKKAFIQNCENEEKVENLVKAYMENYNGKFLENFNYPYIAQSMRDFWRRWHISLSTWFRDYLYIPMGGNRGSSLRTYLNLWIVFLLCGLWHGASWNFVIWGALHGAYLVIERLGWHKYLDRLWIPLRHLYTLLLVMIA